MTDPMTDPTIDQQAELILATAAGELVGVRDGECLYCYVARMLDELDCDNTLRFVRRYREQRAPAATGLERSFEAIGGYCDCEIFLNGMTIARSLCIRDEETGDWSEPETMPDCQGVERGSTKNCANWERQAGGGW
jgi:hypothetical protein